MTAASVHEADEVLTEFPRISTNYNRAMRAYLADLIVDSDRREVTRGDRVVALNPKAYDLLLALVESWPSAVSKEALYERLWPGVFVEMGNLHNLVSDIRLAVNDEKREIIRTVHRFGYAIGVAVTNEGTIRAHLIIGTREFPLHEGENVIGRDLVGNADVSRRHARIVIRGSRATIEDLGSKNGTWIEKRRLDAPFSFSTDQEVVLGRTRALIRFTPESGSTLTAAPL